MIALYPRICFAILAVFLATRAWSFSPMSSSMRARIVSTDHRRTPSFSLEMVATSESEVAAAAAVNEPPSSPSTIGELTADDLLIGVVDQQQNRRWRDFGITSLLNEPSLNAGRAMVIAAAAIYGTNFATVKMLEAHIPTAVSASLRFALAAIAVSAAVFANEPKLDMEDGSAKKIIEQERLWSSLAGMEVGAWYCVGYLCQAWGLQTADASKSAFFNALAVMVVPLLDMCFRGRHMTPSKGLSVLLAVLGVGLLQLGPGFSFQVEKGDLFCLSQAIFFGIGYWRLEHVSAAFPAHAGRCTAGQLTAVALGSIAYLLLLSHGGLPSLAALSTWLSDPFIVKSLLWTGLVSTALALYLETVALKVVSAHELTVLMTSVSLWGSAFAFATMGEVLSPMGMIGGAMILGACLCSSSTDEEEEQKE